MIPIPRHYNRILANAGFGGLGIVAGEWDKINLTQIWPDLQVRNPNIGHWIVEDGQLVLYTDIMAPQYAPITVERVRASGPIPVPRLTDRGGHSTTLVVVDDPGTGSRIVWRTLSTLLAGSARVKDVPYSPGQSGPLLEASPDPAPPAWWANLLPQSNVPIPNVVSAPPPRWTGGTVPPPDWGHVTPFPVKSPPRPSALSMNVVAEAELGPPTMLPSGSVSTTTIIEIAAVAAALGVLAYMFLRH